MMDHLPEDPVILLSYLNTTMRDYRIDLEELAKTYSVSTESLLQAMDEIGYEYDAKQRKFI